MKTALFFCLLVALSLSCTFPLAPLTPPLTPLTPPLTSPEPAPAPTPRVVMTTVTAARSVNIREKATVHSDDIGDLWHGQVVYVSRCDDGWARIPEGWVNSYYLDGVCP